MQFRTRVYDSIVDWPKDGSWHEIRDLEGITKASEPWLVELKRDPHFESTPTRRGSVCARKPLSR